MSFDLNNPNEFTLANVRQLIASGDVNTAIQLRVSLNGRVDLVPANESSNLNGLAFRFPPWLPEDNRVGPVAAQDDQWVLRVYALLRKNWPNPNSRIVDTEDPLESSPVVRPSTT